MSLSVPVFTPKKANTPPPGFSTTVRFIGLWMHTLITSIYNATIANFAEAYVRIAAEQHGVYPIPERLPTEREVADMISNANYMRSSLEAVRQTVQEANERASAAGKAKSYEDEDSHMYDSAKQNYGIGEVKKRRGRAAPPGRCHSCNRIDTPEWRRGPDGARTLCNACGLHYAKLERKRQLEARQIRPKSPQRP
ncbi:GATA zinc finger domain-containing protein 10 like [Verticillium longisporum]|uniref:GATA zinc finger domain-containing protein 10 like n=1 Tax=Verticillium longisporum TaxID=100787 RepID=A0A8I3ALC9_VERLO|nr:GATA zinc finger domain-containing protein 10 like [Verticillium longisporum]